MNNLTNYHSHCSYCDGKADLEQFILAAIRAGFTNYGISSHAPVPFPAPWALDKERVGEYISEARELQQRYQNLLELSIGMEIDYIDSMHNPANDYFQNLPLDYRIGSVHLIPGVNGQLVDIDSSAEHFALNLQTKLGGNLKAVVIEYYDRLMAMIRLGGFDFLAHADKISLNASTIDPEIQNRPWYKDKITEYFHTIAQHRIPIEINTKAWAKHQVTFPNVAHFPLIKELGIPVLVNSDAHRPELINSGRSETIEALWEAGIENLIELRQGHWSTTPISLIYQTT